MLGSWGCKEAAAASAPAEPKPGKKRVRLAKKQTRSRVSPDTTHPVPDSRVLRYAPSRCHRPPIFNLPHTGSQPHLDSTDCKLTVTSKPLIFWIVRVLSSEEASEDTLRHCCTSVVICHHLKVLLD